MIVLGITDGISCGAAIVQDGRIVSAVNEEALSRLKMAYGFPRQSIAEVMRLAGVSSADIDVVTVATQDNYFFDGVRPWKGWFTKKNTPFREVVFRLAGHAAPLAALPGVEAFYYKSRAPIFKRRRDGIQKIIGQEFDIQAPVEFVDHHLAHCASAYFTSGFDDAMLVSMDGGGDKASSHIYVARNGQFEKVAQTSAFNSLANFYAYVTEICGFVAQKHEGKITGLAAHGEPRYRDLLNSLVTFEDGELKNVGHVLFGGALKAILSRLPAGWTREDLSASIQQHSEDLAVAYVKHHLQKHPNKNLAIAGGLFANVRINQKVGEIPGVSRLFVHPGMTDGGLAVGAALTLCISNGTVARMPGSPEVIGNVYYGAAYSDSEIQAALDEKGLQYTRPACIEQEAAKLLAEGYVVARFDGRMEYGPRALGNRSILYQAGEPSVNDWLNTLLCRTEFMPFAPATLMEYAEESYENVNLGRETARFMTVTFDCTEKMKRTCGGAIHIDNTARPQLVRAEDNPSYYKIIDEYRKITGVPTVINTSFNMHEEPIVYSPADAVRAFLQGHLDYLAIGNFLVKSVEPPKHELTPVRRVAS